MAEISTIKVMSPEIAVDRIARQTPEAQAIIRLLLAQIADRKAERAALRTTPHNSSLPPSTPHPHAQPDRGRSTPKRKRGGRPGHPKHERPLLPTTDGTAVVPLRPTACRCGRTRRTGADQSPLRPHVGEIPAIRPLVTEYPRRRRDGPRCGTSTRAQLPPGVPTGPSGPRRVALTATRMACFRQSKRRTALFASAALNIPRRPSRTIKHPNLATQALRPVYDELVQKLPTPPRLNGDESPTKEGPTKSWLGTFVARTSTGFAVRGSRAGTAIRELPGESLAGVTTCDRAKMYGPCGRLPWCWAHLKRDVPSVIDHPDRRVKRLGQDRMRPTKGLCRHGSRCPDGTTTRPAMLRQLGPIRGGIGGLLRRGAGSGNPRRVGMCAERNAHRQRRWTVLEVDGVEPTNNAAERRLRPAVIWRGVSFGTQSASGSRFVEALLSVMETCRQQNRNVLDSVTQALEAHFQSTPTPSFLTGP